MPSGRLLSRALWVAWNPRGVQDADLSCTDHRIASTAIPAATARRLGRRLPQLPVPTAAHRARRSRTLTEVGPHSSRPLSVKIRMTAHSCIRVRLLPSRAGSCPQGGTNNKGTTSGPRESGWRTPSWPVVVAGAAGRSRVGSGQRWGSIHRPHVLDACAHMRASIWDVPDGVPQIRRCQTRASRWAGAHRSSSPEPCR